MTIELLQNNEGKYFKLKDGHEIVLIPFADINYIESDGNYVIIYCTSKKYLSRQKLESIYEELNSPIFCKAHRNYIVNMGKVQRYSKKDIILLNNTVIPLSRSLVDDFEKRTKLVQAN